MIINHKDARHRRKLIAHAVNNGENSEDVAEKFGVSIPLVYMACKENKIKLARRGGRLLPVPIIFRVLRALIDGKTLISIAKTYRTDPLWIKKLRQRAIKNGWPELEKR